MPGASAGSILRVLDGLNAKKQAIIDAGIVTETTLEEVTTKISLTDLWLSQPDDHARVHSCGEWATRSTSSPMGGERPVSA